MEKVEQVMLGNTGLQVSKFCLGTLPIGPLQANLSEKKCVELIETSLSYGVNFIDTAEVYQTQPFIGKAIQDRQSRAQTVIATKSTAKTYDEMAQSLEKSLSELNTDYIDIYHLHAARADKHVFENRQGALQFLSEMKEQGVISAVGISTHSTEVVHRASSNQEIDVVYPLINQQGFGIQHGSKEDMIREISNCHAVGQGVYAMKVLGGGNMIHNISDNINWVENIKGMSSLSIGITSKEELKYNLSLFGVEELQNVDIPDTTKPKKLLILELHCTGCGNCVATCPNFALSLQNQVAKVDHNKCILCGYCSTECPQFTIRVI